MKVNFRLSQSEIEALTPHCQEGESLHLAAKRLMLERVKDLNSNREVPKEEDDLKETFNFFLGTFIDYAKGLLLGIAEHDRELFRVIASHLQDTAADPVLELAYKQLIGDDYEPDDEESPIT